MKNIFLLLGMLGLAPPLAADELRVAVATNFVDVMTRLADAFERQSGHEVSVSSGATGKLYAQIRNGAPFDLFLAADEQRPRLLEQQGIAVPDSRFTYALGKLVLWSPEAGYIDDSLAVLKEQRFRFLSIANPATAPYGRAAREVLEKLGLWDQLQGSMVRGENIGQAYQYVYSRNAQLGFVAQAQVFRHGSFGDGSYWLVPEDLYAPIIQQAALLTDSAAARDLLEYLRGPEASAVIASYGYGVPGDDSLLSQHE